MRSPFGLQETFSQKLNFYFSEKVTGVVGKSVYVYEFAPGTQLVPLLFDVLQVVKLLLTELFAH